MAMNNQHSGTLRTDQEANLARLDDFQVLTSDLRIQLHRLEKSGGTLRPLLENHVLTVLADISRKQLSGYGESFADAQGTADVARYAEKLRRDVEDWSRRLEAYILQGLMSGRSGSVAIEIAQKLDDSLKAILPDGSVAKKEDYYRMLCTVTAIQKQADRYTKQAEESGDTEPALALLQLRWHHRYFQPSSCLAARHLSSGNPACRAESRRAGQCLRSHHLQGRSRRLHLGGRHGIPCRSRTGL